VPSLQTPTNIDTYFIVGSYIFSFLVGGVLALSTHIKKLFIKKVEIASLPPNFVRLHTVLDEYLTEMRVNLNASRTSISKFHNGGHFFDGESILKFTTTNESCSLGTNNTIESSQGLLITRWIGIVGVLQEEGLNLHYTKDITDNQLRGYYEARNTIAFMTKSTICSKGLKTGFISVEWCEYEDIENQDTKDTLNLFEYYTRIINSTINISK